MNKEIATGHLAAYLKNHKKNISHERFIILDTIFNQTNRSNRSTASVPNADNN
ncbi:MAG: hypothetical protein J7L25_12070 [Deltaproteobacteria bacterium]|nr:hypothetical protein [Candidatus Tharpella aukensis]